MVNKSIIKILNLKFVILLKYQNIKLFLQKVIFQIGLQKILWLKITVPWAYVISDFNGEETVVTLCKKELQKTNQKEFRVKKINWKSYKNCDILYVKWKGYDNSFNSWNYRKTQYKWVNFFQSQNL